jgi:hypothetical protein
MSEYDLAMPLLVRVFPFVALAVFTKGVPIIVRRSGPAFLLVPWLAVVGWNWWVLATPAYRVVLHHDGVVEWIAIGRCVKTLTGDIREVHPGNGGSIGFFVVKHAAGKVRFVNQIKGFHEVLVHIKNRNPAVVLKGC